VYIRFFFIGPDSGSLVTALIAVMLLKNTRAATVPIIVSQNQKNILKNK